MTEGESVGVVELHRFHVMIGDEPRSQVERGNVEEQRPQPTVSRRLGM